MNASSVWLVPDDVLFYQDGLDEDVPHTLTVVNTGSNSSLSLSAVDVYSFAQAEAAVSS